MASNNDNGGRDMASNNDNEVIISLAIEVTQQNGYLSGSTGIKISHHLSFRTVSTLKKRR